jgi:hypothetical protein
MRPKKIVLATLSIVTAAILVTAIAPQAALAALKWTDTGGGMRNEIVYSLAYDSKHNVLYAATDLDGIWKYNGTTWTKTRGGPHSGLSLAYDSEHNVLYDAGTLTGVWKYNGTTWTNTEAPLWGTILSLAYDSEHNVLYAAGDDGVWKYNGTTWTNTGGDMSYYQPFSLAYDSVHNVLYAGGDVGGVRKYNGSTWADTGGGEMRDWRVWSLAYDSEHNVLYAGTEGDGGVWRYNGTTWTKTGGGLKAHTVWSLAYDSANNVLYAGTDSGVWSYNGTAWTNTGGEVSDENVDCIAYDSAHNALYAGTRLHGVWKAGGYAPATSTWYLAEGSTAWGFACGIGIMNPNTSAVKVKVTYMTDTGEVDGGAYEFPAMSAGYVDPKTTLGQRDFSTKVQCLDKKPIAVDRTMFFAPLSGANVFEGHASVGVNAAAKQWFLPEGSSSWGFECWLCIQNPNSSEAKCDVTYMIEGEGTKTVPHTIPANSRKTFNMAADIGGKDASIKVESNVPVIPERAMYRNGRREGHESIGTTGPGLDYYLAEGTTAWGFTTYVLVQNPNKSEADVTITYMTPSGPKQQPRFTMPADSRMTIRVNDVPGVSSTDLSTRVHGSKPIIAERAMYWIGGADSGEACHDSVGLAEPHKRFYLPTGEVGGGYGTETYTSVQNLNASSVKVRVTYVTLTGEGNVQFDATILGQTRMTFNMADKVPAGDYGVIVESLTAGKPIMVERSMYFLGRACGTNTIGGYGD